MCELFPTVFRREPLTDLAIHATADDESVNRHTRCPTLFALPHGRSPQGRGDKERLRRDFHGKVCSPRHRLKLAQDDKAEDNFQRPDLSEAAVNRYNTGRSGPQRSSWLQRQKL